MPAARQKVDLVSAARSRPKGATKLALSSQGARLRPVDKPFQSDMCSLPSSTFRTMVDNWSLEIGFCKR